MSVTVVEAGNTLTTVTGISYKERLALFTLRTLKPNNNFLCLYHDAKFSVSSMYV